MTRKKLASRREREARQQQADADDDAAHAPASSAASPSKLRGRRRPILKILERCLEGGRLYYLIQRENERRTWLHDEQLDGASSASESDAADLQVLRNYELEHGWRIARLQMRETMQRSGIRNEGELMRGVREAEEKLKRRVREAEVAAERANVAPVQPAPVKQPAPLPPPAPAKSAPAVKAEPMDAASSSSAAVSLAAAPSTAASALPSSFVPSPTLTAATSFSPSSSPAASSSLSQHSEAKSQLPALAPAPFTGAPSIFNSSGFASSSPLPPLEQYADEEEQGDVDDEEEGDVEDYHHELPQVHASQWFKSQPSASPSSFEHERKEAVRPNSTPSPPPPLEQLPPPPLLPPIDPHLMTDGPIDTKPEPTILDIVSSSEAEPSPPAPTAATSTTPISATAAPESSNSPPSPPCSICAESSPPAWCKSPLPPRFASLILTCATCNVSVHAACYGVSVLPLDGSLWWCAVCDPTGLQRHEKPKGIGEKENVQREQERLQAAKAGPDRLAAWEAAVCPKQKYCYDSRSVRCMACGQLGGALVPTNYDFNYLHVFCARYLPTDLLTHWFAPPARFFFLSEHLTQVRNFLLKQARGREVVEPFC